MAYCDPGVKATVKYTFGDTTSKVYVAEKTPITINIEEVPGFAGGQCECVLYRVYFSYMSSPSNTAPRQYGNNVVYGAVQGLSSNQIFNSDSTSSFTIYLIGKSGFPSLGFPCGTPGYKKIARSGGLFAGFLIRDLRIESIEVESVGSNECGDPKKLCSIEVLHNNQIIFSDRGDCPIDFSVICGNECPPGTIKCQKSGYPGYCCLPCPPIKSEIAAITNQLRRLNNG